MALRDRLNQYAKRAGNSLYSGLGDILTTEINPKYLLSVAVLAGSLALSGNVHAQDVSKNLQEYSQIKKVELCKTGKDICERVNKLGDNEYIVPDEVASIYEKIFTHKENWPPFEGMFLPYDTDPSEIKKIQEELESKNYTKKEIDTYLNILGRGNIIITKYMLNWEEFNKIIVHERMHREYHNLSLDKKIELGNAFQEYMVKIKKDYSKVGPNEFFAYLAGFATLHPKDNPEQTLKQVVPRAYEIYLKMKNNARVK